MAVAMIILVHRVGMESTVDEFNAVDKNIAGERDLSQPVPYQVVSKPANRRK